MNSSLFSDWVLSTDQLAFALLFPLSLFFLFFGLDDFFIDWTAWRKKLSPKKLGVLEFQQMYRAPEKRLAVMIASWKEEGILRKMIRGNLGLIQYQNCTFFLGVYPNDPETIKDAEALEAEFPNVHRVINTRNGPTSKGQMINQLVREIFRRESLTGMRYDAFIIHDSEDIINPHAFKLMNWKLSEYEFVQIPVFSLPLSWRSLVAGTYVDEFSESHTKDILVRHYLGAALPSAGVGTAVSRRLVKKICEKQSGDLLNPDSLTEDYEG